MTKSKPFQVEYVIRSSPAILFNFLTTPSGLAQWFADSVDVNHTEYVFTWEGYEEKAKILDMLENQYVRYKWDASDKGEYFEFKIQKAEITDDTILVITDFATERDREDQARLWDSQVKTLIQQIGG